MGLITTEVEITLNARTTKHYESLEYKIPKRKDNWGRMITPKGTKIKVKVKDLTKGCESKVKVKCDLCEKEYELRYCDYLKYNHDTKIYCNDCAKKTFNTGENHPCWNPNMTQEERENGRGSPQYTDFIKKVFIRDKYICQCCKKELNHDGIIHHLDSWDTYKEKRYDETNGIALCEKCHKNFHLIYGYGNNNKEQFEKWIGYAIELLKYEGDLPTARKIYCIEEDKVYNGAEELAKEWNYKSKQNIYKVCNHSEKYKSVRGKHLLWVDEYEKMSNNDIMKYLEYCKPKKRKEVDRNGYTNPMARKIICITTNKLFNTIKEAGDFYNIKGYSNIGKCCKGDYKTYGKLKDGTRLQWMYYEDYINQLSIHNEILVQAI